MRQPCSTRPHVRHLTRGRYLQHRVQKYCVRRGAAHVTVGVTVACKLMRACSRDLPQLLGSLRALTSFLLQQESAWCNVQGLLLLQEFAEHRHSSAVALLHTFNPDICALMGKEASMAGLLSADCAAVHGAAAAAARALFLTRLCSRRHQHRSVAVEGAVRRQQHRRRHRVRAGFR